MIHTLSLGYVEHNVFKESAKLEWFLSNEGNIQAMISFRPNAWQLFCKQSHPDYMNVFIHRVSPYLGNITGHDVFCRSTLIPVAFTKELLPSLQVNDVFARRGCWLFELEQWLLNYWWFDCIEIDIDTQELRCYIGDTLFIHESITNRLPESLTSESLQIKATELRGNYSDRDLIDKRKYLLLKQPLITWQNKRKKRKYL